MKEESLKDKIENQIVDFHAKFIVDILEKLLKKKPEKGDAHRIKIIPIIGKSMSSMISFDNVVIGVLEGRFDYANDGLAYICEFIPAAKYQHENPATNN